MPKMLIPMLWRKVGLPRACCTAQFQQDDMEGHKEIPWQATEHWLSVPPSVSRSISTDCCDR